MNPYAPPGPEQEHGDDEPKKKKKKKKRGLYDARFEGNVLVVSRDAELPSVCLKCGRHDEILHRPAKFQWTPVWARVLLPFCALGGILAMAITRKHASLGVPLCAPCNKRWDAARNATIVGVVFLVISLVVVRMSDEPKNGLGFVVVALFAFLGLAFGFSRPRTLQVDRITDAEVHLKNFHTTAAQEIVDGSR